MYIIVAKYIIIYSLLCSELSIHLDIIKTTTVFKYFTVRLPREKIRKHISMHFSRIRMII